MADRKLLTARRLITWLAWAGFVLTYLILLLLPSDVPGDVLFLALALVLVLILVSILCAVALAAIYHRLFGQWRSAAAVAITLAICRWATNHLLLPGSFGLAVIVLSIDAIFVLGVCLALVLWKRDDGLRLLGWMSAGTIWVLLIANRLQGNLIDLLLSSLGETGYSPLWWLDAAWCLLWWSIPLGVLSFAWHTLRLIRKEIQGT